MQQRFGMLGLVAGLAMASIAAPAIERAPRFEPLPPVGRGTVTHVATSEPMGRRAARRARGRARATAGAAS